MTEMITTGIWVVDEAKHDAFIDAWSVFSAWASSMDGAGTLRLGRASRDPNRFVSFAPWASGDQVLAWKSSPEFRDHMAQVLQHVDDFVPSELEVVAAATKGSTTAPNPIPTR